MGCFWSWKPALSFDCIRVVHVNGYVEDFQGPLTAGQLVAKTPKHFVCSAANLLSFGTRTLASDLRLERGRVYFLLPHSIFQSDSSPVDLVYLATRLTAIAKRTGPSMAKSRCKSGTQLTWGRVRSGKQDQSSMTSQTTTCRPVYGGRMSCRANASWKPILETIEEKSLERQISSC